MRNTIVPCLRAVQIRRGSTFFLHVLRVRTATQNETEKMIRMKI